MKRYGWLAITLLILILAIFIDGFFKHLKIERTRDSLAVVCVSFGHSAPGHVITSGKLAENAKKEFPWLKMANGSLLDEWGHPIRIQINGARIEVKSAGADGIMDTNDDLTRTAELVPAQ